MGVGFQIPLLDSKGTVLLSVPILRHKNTHDFFFLSYKEKKTGPGLTKIWVKGKDNVGEISKLTFSYSNQHCVTLA